MPAPLKVRADVLRVREETPSSLSTSLRPWLAGPTVIPELGDRGITVQQLRALQLLLQRLCKAGLLERAGRPPARPPCGACFSWTSVNMYDISDLVIRPLVTHLCERRAGRGEGRDGDGRLSWVELVAPCPRQRPRLLLSHYWGGRFSDFMSAVEAVVVDRGLRARDAIWICTFANSQFGEDFGPTLEQSPFYRAILAAEGTILVADRDAGSLERIWCGLELHFTIKLGKDLAIYTSRGQVGSRAVTSGPLVEALQSWDITRCEASQPSDRRQILNYLADPESECDGLRKDAEGKLLLADGWRKELEDDRLAAGPGARVRINGQPEFQHEDELIRGSASTFECLNHKIHEKVKSAATDQQKCRAPLGRAATPYEQCATLGQLRAFVKAVKGLLVSTGGPSYRDMSSYDLCEYAKSGQLGVEPYFESLGGTPLCAQYVIEHMHAGKFADAVAGIEWFAEARRLGDETALWWDLFAFKLYTWDRPHVTDEYWHLRQDAQGALFLWPVDDGLVDVNRAFLMLTLQHFLCSGGVVDFATAGGIMACTRPFVNGSWSFGAFSPAVARKLAEVDARESRAGDPEDQRWLREQLRAAPGGCEALSRRLRRIAAGPVIRDAALRGCQEDIAEIQRLCDCPGLVINSEPMKGSLNETAAHVAAAAGRLAALKALMDLGADSNAKDHIDETPLHYAALAGQASCAKLLLCRGANADAESAFGDTPLDVAEASVAEFLRVDTQRVTNLLAAWKDSDSS